MNHGVRRRILSSAAASAAALVVAASVHAHGGETFMIAEPNSVPPGGAVGITADLLTSGPLDLTLAGPDGSRRGLGVVDGTTDGHFQVVIEVPADLPVGTWMLFAEADGTVYGSTIIEVSGSAIEAEGGGQGPRDEDDALLVPLPSGWQAVRSSPPGSSPPSAPGSTPDLVPIISLAAAMGALALLFVRTRRPRPGGTGTTTR